MSVSFDFEDNYTQAISETQQIDDQSSDEDGDSKICIFFHCKK